MNANDTKELLNQIRAIWRTVDTGDAAVKVWSRSLADLPLEAAEQALDAYTRGVSDDYPPKPADLRRMIVDALLNLPSIDDAWLIVVGEARRVGLRHTIFHDGVSYLLEPTFTAPEIALAAEAVGWDRIVGNRKDSFTMRAFQESYDRYVNRTRNKALLDMSGIEDFRRMIARDLRAVTIGEPKGLFQLGAPAAFALAVDGSGPDKVNGPNVLPPSIESSVTPYTPPAVPASIAQHRAAMIDAGINLISDRVRPPSALAKSGSS